MSIITENEIKLFSIELLENQEFKKSEIPIFLLKDTDG